jgi:uncharacterized membrane protein YdcZ (DUF606 family)
MRLRPRRGNLVLWSSSGTPDGSWAWRPARRRRIRWWLRTGMLLVLIGVMRLARGTRARWEPVSLVAGAALAMIGFMVPAAAVAFFLGLLVLVVTLLKGIATKGRAAGQAADCWQWRG